MLGTQAAGVWDDLAFPLTDLAPGLNTPLIPPMLAHAFAIPLGETGSGSDGLCSDPTRALGLGPGPGSDPLAPPYASAAPGAAPAAQGTQQSSAGTASAQAAAPLLAVQQQQQRQAAQAQAQAQQQQQQAMMSNLPPGFAFANGFTQFQPQFQAAMGLAPGQGAGQPGMPGHAGFPAPAFYHAMPPAAFAYNMQEPAMFGYSPFPGMPGFGPPAGLFPGYPGQPMMGMMPPGSEQPKGEAVDYNDTQARALKRPRLVWTTQLHNCFVNAVNQLGVDKAVPKTIMQLMNIEGLTRENVASHLQKYRLQLKRADGEEGGGGSAKGGSRGGGNTARKKRRRPASTFDESRGCGSPKPRTAGDAAEGLGSTDKSPREQQLGAAPRVTLDGPSRSHSATAKVGSTPPLQQPAAAAPPAAPGGAAPDAAAPGEASGDSSTPRGEDAAGGGDGGGDQAAAAGGGGGEGDECSQRGAGGGGGGDGGTAASNG